MHVTHLCNTALDNPTQRTPEQRVADLLPYLETDTLRFRVPYPERLVQRLSSEWDPVIAWFSAQLGGHAVPVTDGLALPGEPPALVAALRSKLLGLGPVRFTAMENATETAKSMILALALTEGHISAERATHLARLELDHQVWPDLVEKGGDHPWRVCAP
jgi:ATP synthase F1 complex assembly factor 2